MVKQPVREADYPPLPSLPQYVFMA